jgi:nitrile hydratase beta subunit
MNGAHDLGGMQGFGPIEREENEPLFHAQWERRAFGVTILMLTLGYYNGDADRYGIEQMTPVEYLQASYFERWLATVEYNLARLGILTSEELATRIAFFREHPGADPPPMRGAAPPSRPGEAPLELPVPPLAPHFAVGDTVLTRNVHPIGHTRLPRYARGKQGVIQVVHQPSTFPDTNAHGLGKNPQTVYNVRFEGRELWGDSAEPRQVLYLDLWESYLEPIPA